MQHYPSRWFNFRPSALLRVTGGDAAEFLQGQFTNELRQAPGSVTYGLWLNQKGKVVADSHVLRLAPNEFLIMSTNSTAAVIRPRLEEYIIADEVHVQDETETSAGLGLWGADSEVKLARCMGTVPPRGKYGVSHGVYLLSGNCLPGENWLIFGPGPQIAKLDLAQVGSDQEASAAEMTWARILAGIPVIPQDIGPADLPNEGGLEEAAISYTKGCYLGQEVMARLKNLGQVRRRLHVVRGKGNVPPPQASLHQGGKRVGEIRSVAAGEGGFAALAMLSLVNLDTRAGLSLQPDGPPEITIQPHG